MSDSAPKTVVTVTIGGEDYTLRADATPEYTQECATYVDRTMNEIQQQGSIIQAHKAAILSALAITDQLFRARRELDAALAAASAHADRLASEIEASLAS